MAARSSGPAAPAESDLAVPIFLDQLAEALRSGLGVSPQMVQSALAHGHDLLRQGFTVSQVVHIYGDACQAILELAVETRTAIGVDDLLLLTRCVEHAVAAAVTQYGREDTEGENRRVGFFAHELRNLVHTALLAFEVVKTGGVGVAGSTGAVLQRSLVSARDLITRSLAEVRLTQGVQNPEPFLVSGFIEEIAPAARLAAEARGIAFLVMPQGPPVAIYADRQILASAVMNLLQNAVKFTRTRTTVILRVDSTDDRVLLEVQDECGGLPTVDVNTLFQPFEQRGADRSGLGLGLAFSRWAVEANNGRLYARTLPTVGCVFTVDLPQFPAPGFAAA